jgi:hypothetical protein
MKELGISNRPIVSNGVPPQPARSTESINPPYSLLLMFSAKFADAAILRVATVRGLPGGAVPSGPSEFAAPDEGRCRAGGPSRGNSPGRVAGGRGRAKGGLGRGRPGLVASTGKAATLFAAGQAGSDCKSTIIPHSTQTCDLTPATILAAGDLPSGKWLSVFFVPAVIRTRRADTILLTGTN